MAGGGPGAEGGPGGGVGGRSPRVVRGNQESWIETRNIIGRNEVRISVNARLAKPASNDCISAVSGSCEVIRGSPHGTGGRISAQLQMSVVTGIDEFTFSTRLHAPAWTLKKQKMNALHLVMWRTPERQISVFAYYIFSREIEIF